MLDPRFKQKPLHGCSGCGQDFTSTLLFDAHRTGVYVYTLEEGLKLDPPREDGRRCLDADEMTCRVRFRVRKCCPKMYSVALSTRTRRTQRCALPSLAPPLGRSLDQVVKVRVLAPQLRETPLNAGFVVAELGYAATRAAKEWPWFSSAAFPFKLRASSSASVRIEN